MQRLLQLTQQVGVVSDGRCVLKQGAIGEAMGLGATVDARALICLCCQLRMVVAHRMLLCLQEMSSA